MSITKPDYLPRPPRYYLVRLDEPTGPNTQKLSYHYFGKDRLKRGDRVCIKDGVFAETFATVIRRQRKPNGKRGYSYRIERAKTMTITTTVQPFPGEPDATQFSLKVEVG